VRLIRLTCGLAYFANTISRSRGCIAAIDWMMDGPISVILSIRCSPIRIDYASAWKSIDWRDLQRIIIGTMRNCGVDFHAELSRLERPTTRSSPIKNAHANRRGATAGSRNEGSAYYGSRLPQIYSQQATFLMGGHTWQADDDFKSTMTGTFKRNRSIVEGDNLGSNRQAKASACDCDCLVQPPVT